MDKVKRFLSENKRGLLLMLFCLAFVPLVFAQGGVNAKASIDKLGSISGDLKNSIFNVATIIGYIVVGGVGVVNGVKAYTKIQSGEDSGKNLGAYFGAIIFILVAITVVRMVFIDA